MMALQVHYEGRVQGVGFRYSAKRLAQGFDVAGSVRNLPDGRVEMLIRGEQEEVHAFLAEIRESSLAGHITAEHKYDIEIPTPFKGFQILP